MFRFSPRPNRANLIPWHQWGPRAFQQAQAHDKPIMLFLAAFWCGVCHRMDELAFSDETVIALVSAYFIPIRVDEARRPDVDLRYNQNGWPTLAFMTPRGDVLATTNYQDPPRLADLLVQVHHFYSTHKKELAAMSPRDLPESPRPEPSAIPPGHLPDTIPAEVSDVVLALADPAHGGYGKDHKFPHVAANELLLQRTETTGDPVFRDHVLLTLDRMRQGKLYDAGSGGFFRYSSKPNWSEPHREKLLADQAGLLKNYLHAYLLTGRQEYRETAEALVQHLNTALSDPSGVAFFGCQDYVRTAGHGSQQAGSTPPPELSVIDDWVYVDANAQAASAYLEAWWLLGRSDCRDRALRVLEFLWEQCRGPAGGMLHAFHGEPHGPSLLADNVAMGTALVDAYRTLGDQRYLDRARYLAEVVLRDYANPAGGFYDILPEELGHLRIRLTVVTLNAAAAAFLLGLADLGGGARFRDAARWALQAFADDFRNYGVFAAAYGLAAARYLSAPLRVSLRGPAGHPGVRGLARAALTRLGHPNTLLTFTDSTASPQEVAVHLALTQGETIRHLGPIADASALTPELLSLPLSSPGS